MAKLTIRIWILIISLFLAALMIFNWNSLFESGVVIQSIEQNSTALNEGLKPGMVLKDINNYQIKNSDDYAGAISKIFISNNETRLSITTDKGSFVFFADNLSEMTISQIPKTRIKTGLDLSGGARAIIKPANFSASQDQLNDLVAITNERLNAFGLKDVTVRSARDLEGNNFMIVEIAGATPSDVKELLGKQGKFEAKIANQTVFIGGEKDISDVCRSQSCAAIRNCLPVQSGYACSFAFEVFLTKAAAQRHAELTKNLSLDSSGQYLSEKLNLLLDDREVESLLIGSELRGRATTEIQIQGSGSGSTQKEALENAKHEMNRLQTILLTGSLPYQLEIVKLDTISPTLGTEFSRSLVYLGVVVFCIISLALFVKYRKIKITLSVILTMISEATLTLAIAAFIKWNLDAPAIAGIIAGMGTGVNDQIVIIDETFSREISHGSLKERIKGAFFIIIGAFLTIIAAMLPLFWAGAGLLKGFALTTIIGVTVGIVITRPAFSDIIKKIAS